ncbi:hypothetical protein [Flaviaesturariibacter terrae]
MMPRNLLLAALLLSAGASSAQKTEFRIALNSGLFHFGGPGATSATQYQVYTGGSGRVASQYGKRMAPASGVAVEVQTVGVKRFIGGISLAYERLRSRSRIDTVQTAPYNGSQWKTAADQSSFTELNSGFFTLHLFIGGRLIDRRVKLDLTVGPEIAFETSSKQVGKVTYTDASGRNQAVSVFYSTEQPGIDFRGRSNLMLRTGRFGLQVGYSAGVTNWSQANGSPAGKPAYLRGLRFGISWKLN